MNPAFSFVSLAALLVSVPTMAQDTTSREVVQPLPSAEVQRLNRALMQLAKRPKSVDALLEAGDASTAVGDLEAAIGFYGRASDLSPNNPRINLGMANVLLRAGRPVEALPLFASAQSAGAEAKDMLSDRALAFDMVGDNSSAQSAYMRAIALNPEDKEAKRRLAISYAISGNNAGFESTLRPLLDDRDFASFRARSFGLAIMGEQDRAAAIVEAVMPRDLAARITPYLSFMPRLTKAQQAAAANLGIFPRAADIGREDPQIAAFVSGASSSDAGARGADSRLAPAGEPLGGARRENVANAFADMGGSDLPAAESNSDAVDIAAIEVPREASAPEVAEPPKPSHPSRVWVQVATGRDVSALKFDWRRIARQADDLLDDLEPHVTPWGQSNRLLAGPVANRTEARDLVNALKGKGIDTFSYTSPEGTEIKELK